MLKRMIGVLLVLSVMMTSIAMVGTASAEVEKKFVVDGNFDIWYLSDEETPIDDGAYYHFPALNAYWKTGGVSPYFSYETHAEVYSAYDDEYVYFYIKVWDDELIPYDESMPDSSHSDSIEIWFDPDPMSQTKHPDGTDKTADEIKDGFNNNTPDPTQGDIQVRYNALSGVRDDYHPTIKPGYGGVTFGDWVNNPNNFCGFTFKDEPYDIENEDGDIITVSSGYGVEARFPRNSGYNSVNYQYNIAINNAYNVEEGEDDTYHYALALNKAWWQVYDNCNAIMYNTERNPFFDQKVGNQKLQYTESEVNKKSPAGAVVKSISNLPATDKLTAADKATVDAIASAYEALDEVGKGYVQYMNYDVLKKAIEALSGEVPEPVVRGDVNGDGKTDATDALLVLQGAVGKKNLTDAQKAKSDLTGDGKIDATDALVALKIAVGK
jgi:hypothetical protein